MNLVLLYIQELYELLIGYESLIGYGLRGGYDAN